LIRREIIDLIVDTARIDEVVGDFVSIKKRGGNFIGLCPFHNEKTPSFNVNAARNIYKCFGCGKGGDVVSFVMEHEQASYPEALRYLAGKYNIVIEEDDKSPERTAEDQLRESLFSVTSFAQKFFTEQLHETDEGKSIGLSYFREREISDHSVAKFQLGYSPEGWSNLTDAAITSGYKKEFLEKTGVTIFKNEKQYDRFRGRVMFPIHSVSGKVIGFGARTLRADPKIPKYLNSPESEIYHKSKVLYGIFFAKKTIVQKDECYLVEGYTDVISLHQSGIENVVASSGTALTSDQIRLISRYTKNVTVLFDGDPAGIKASFRGIDLILEQGLNVKIIAFEEGVDPDSYAREHSNQEVQDFLQKKAVNFIKFKTSLLLEDVKNDPIGKTRLIREIMRTIALIPDNIARSTYVKECSTLLEIEEPILIQELNKIIRSKFKRDDLRIPAEQIPEDLLVSHKAEAVDEDYVYSHEKNIIRLLLNYGGIEIELPNKIEETDEHLVREVRSVIVYELVKDKIFMGDPIFRKIFEEAEKGIQSGTKYNVNDFIRHEDQEIRNITTELLSTQYNLSDNWRHKGIVVSIEKDVLPESVISSIITLKMSSVEKMITENREKIKSSEESQLEYLISTHQDLEKIKAELASERGIVILK